MNQPQQKTEVEAMTENATAALKGAWGFLAKSATSVKQKADEHGVTDKMKSAASSVKATSDSTGFTNVLVGTQKNISKYGHQAAEYSIDSGKAVVASAKDGTLKEKSASAANNAGAMIGGFGSSLYAGAASWGFVAKPDE